MFRHVHEGNQIKLMSCGGSRNRLRSQQCHPTVGPQGRAVSITPHRLPAVAFRQHRAHVCQNRTASAHDVTYVWQELRSSFSLFTFRSRLFDG